MIRNVIITGIGGQGVVTAAGILRWAALGAGLHLTGSDNRGGAQRLGHVAALIRITDEADRVLAPELAPGSCDLLISLEASEGLRFLAAFGKQTAIWTSPLIRIPTNQRRLRAPYPDLAQCLEAYRSVTPRVTVCDFSEVATANCGDGRLGNLVALGMACDSLGLPAIGRFLAEHLEDPQRSAFRLGLAWPKSLEPPRQSGPRPAKKVQPRPKPHPTGKRKGS